MHATIKINMDNSAFEDNPAIELQRILSELANGLCIVHGGMEESLRDINGNKVGNIKITD